MKIKENKNKIQTKQEKQRKTKIQRTKKSRGKNEHGNTKIKEEMLYLIFHFL